VPQLAQERVVVGLDPADDAGVVRLDDERLLVGTVDFITPLVDDARAFGAIAAANSVSDIFAMGAKPLFALSIACYPEDTWPLDLLGEMLAGGAEKLGEAACPVIGGHTVSDDDMKLGYSVVGLACPEHLWRKAGARPGDELVLTKRLGTGILATAARARKERGTAWDAAVAQMQALNDGPAACLPPEAVHAATDITGFGLAGHACEMARSSGVTLELEAAALPVLDGALYWAARGQLTRARSANREYVSGACRLAPGLDPALLEVFFDAQTSGGLLLAVDPAVQAVSLLRAAGGDAWRVGTVAERGATFLSLA